MPEEAANDKQGKSGDESRERTLGRFARDLKQVLLYPSAHRIAAFDVGGDTASDSMTHGGLSGKEGDHHAAGPPDVAGETTQLLQTLATVVTALWRIREKLNLDAQAELPADLRHVPRHVQSAWDALIAGGFDVQDHVGQRYDPGMAVTPIAYQPIPGIAPNIICEALKPTVYYKDKLIQKGDVIVAGPSANDEDSATGSAE